MRVLPRSLQIPLGRGSVGAALVALCLAGPPLVGQSTPVKLTAVTPLEGLSSGVVTAVLRDHAGFLWVGTPDGLNRYDGHEVQVREFDRTDPGTIPNNHIRTLFEDREARLWVGTAGGGLVRLERSTGGFTPVRPSAFMPGQPGSDWVESLTQDAEGALWIGTLGGGLSRYDPSTGTARVFPADPATPGALGNPMVNVVFIDSDERVWVGTDRGLYLWTRETDRFARWLNRPGDPSSLSNDRVLSIDQDSDGRLWIGTENGLNRLDPSESHFTRIPHDGRAGGLGHPHVTALAPGSEGRLWVGTYGGGLHELDTRTLSVVASHRAGDWTTGLLDDRVRRISVEEDGTLWLGTWGGGATRVLPLPVRFTMARHEDTDPTTMGPGEVPALAVEADGTLWAATYFNGLSRRSPGETSFTHFRADPADPHSLSGDDATRLLLSDGGFLWVGTWQNGLNRLDLSTGRFDRYPTDPERPDALRGNRITALAEGPAGELWIGTSDGLNRLESDVPPGRFSLVEGLDGVYVEALLLDATGALWVGTGGSGLVRFERGTIRRFRFDSTRPESLGHDHVTAIHQDPDGGIWVGTLGGGVSRLAEDPGPTGDAGFVHYRESDGLIDNSVAAILGDGLGRLWINTKNGLSILDRESGRFVGFDAGNGLPVDEFAVGAAVRVGDQLAFGTPEGILFAPRDARVPEGVAEPMAVTAARALETGDALPLVNGSTPELPYGEVVAFEFALLDFGHETEQIYEYRLEGLNEDWVDAGTTRDIAFTNLSPGTYTFRARGRTRHGEWSEASIPVRFEIVAPFWMTWWFRVLALVVLAGLVVAALRLRVQGVRHRQQAVRAKEKQFTALLENSHDLVALLDREHRIIYHGPSIRRILGFDVEERLGASPTELAHPDDREAFNAWLEELTLAPNSPKRTAVRLQTSDGRWIDLEVLGTAFFTVEGERRTILNAHDISDRKQAETRSRELEQVLNQRQRLDAIGTLAGGVAHDFNNLLTVIGGHATLLEDAADDPKAIRESASAIRRAQESGASLTRQLLAFARKQVVAPSVLDLNDLVGELRPLLRRVARPDVAVELDLEARWPWVEAARGQLEQVLMNLVINANDAMPDGGHVRIATSNAEFCAEEVPSQDGKDGWVVLSVTDTGTGIDEAVLPHIFEPFYTTKERGQGTGLGLSTVYGIVTQSGGKVTAERGAEGGSLFRVYLPRAARQAIASASRTARVVTPRAGAAVVLVAEDDQGIRNLVSRVLTGAGHEVLTAEDGVDATRILEALDRPPDLLLTDLVMPRMGGGELARRVRASSPGTPVLFMSGYADTVTLGGGVGPDDDVLLKPFTPEGLVARVHTALSEGGGGPTGADSTGADPSTPASPVQDGDAES